MAADREEHPQERLKIRRQRPTPEILAYQGQRVEVAGQVDDLRPHLAAQRCRSFVRIGGGTRFKIWRRWRWPSPSFPPRSAQKGSTPSMAVISFSPTTARRSPRGGRVLDDRCSRPPGERRRALVEERFSWQRREPLEQLYQELTVAR